MIGAVSRTALLFSISLFACVGLSAPLAGGAPASSGTAGIALFKQRCSTCHVTEAGKASPLGPNLAGVVGRRAGSAQFRYSPALKGSELTWTKTNLDAYLAAPGQLVPGTRMVISVPDKAQRAELIKYLASLSATAPDRSSARLASAAR